MDFSRILHDLAVSQELESKTAVRMLIWILVKSTRKRIGMLGKEKDFHS